MITPAFGTPPSRLNALDFKLKLSGVEEMERTLRAQDRLLWLRLALGGLLGGTEKVIGPPVCIVFEGWDASGKGGCIKRLVAPMEARHVRVASFAAPTYTEKRHHHLGRFWPVLPGKGGMTILDRSWYGRPLVERIEGFCSEAEWRRSYEEIRDFERALTDDGMILLKFWLHLSPEEQLRRFRSRELDPFRSWKLTEEDWRNRARREDYLVAVEDMLDQTGTAAAPWTLVEGDSKRWARVKVLETSVRVIEEGLRVRGFTVPPQPPRTA